MKRVSEVKGVCYHPRDKVWRASIGVNCINTEIGRYKTEEEAVAARKAAEVEKAKGALSAEAKLRVENRKLRAALEIALEANAELRLTVKQLKA